MRSAVYYLCALTACTAEAKKLRGLILEEVRDSVTSTVNNVTESLKPKLPDMPHIPYLNEEADEITTPQPPSSENESHRVLTFDRVVQELDLAPSDSPAVIRPLPFSLIQGIPQTSDETTTTTASPFIPQDSRPFALNNGTLFPTTGANPNSPAISSINTSSPNITSANITDRISAAKKVVNQEVLEEAMKPVEVTEPATYALDDQRLKDPFEGGQIIREPSTSNITNNYFRTENTALTTVDNSVTNQQVIQKNVQVINQARQKGRPLAVLQGIDLPEIFDLSSPPADVNFVWSLLPSSRKNDLDRVAALQDTARLIRALRKASKHYSALAEKEAIEGTSTENDYMIAKASADFRASQVIDMLIAVLKRLYLKSVGVISEEEVIWSVEYQALLHLSPEWQKWIDGLITAILSVSISA